MADTILTIQQVEDLFASLTLQMLGLNPASPANQSRVRISWPVKGAPTWKITEDVAFLLVTLEDDPITQQMDVTYGSADVDNADRTMSYTRVFRINWICYGPNSFNDMETIRTGLFQPDYILALMQKNLALVPDSHVPVRSPELFNGQWWDRTSFYARFNEKAVRHTLVPYLKTADVQILKG